MYTFIFFCHLNIPKFITNAFSIDLLHYSILFFIKCHLEFSSDMSKSYLSLYKKLLPVLYWRMSTLD